MFQGEPQASRTLPDQQTLGTSFIDWLKSRFGWMFQANATTSIGTAYVYGDGEIPGWAIPGDYDNGSAMGAGRSEYIWLPTPDGAIPVGMYRNGKYYAIHTDHLGSPRLMKDEQNKPVWQWPYSAFGAVEPTGILKATPKTPMAGTTQSVALKKKQPEQDLTMRFPGQMRDGESGTNYNYFRSYDARIGRYTQAGPIGLDGGWNRMAYVDGNPLSFIDPDGLAPKYEKPPNPNKKPPPPHRVPSNERERNVGHENAEEHSRTSKGQRGTKGSRGARGVGGLFIWDLLNNLCDENPGLPGCAPFKPPESPCEN